MKGLVGALLYAQSGGPTSVINSSASGVFTEGLKNPSITAVYGSAYGINGIIKEDFYDISKAEKSELELLKYTPSAVLGSVRYKLKDAKSDESDYKRIREVFAKYNIRYFFYNGGNDSMDTCKKISEYLKKTGYDCNVLGIPKTIDNDLVGTDHTPGFGTAAKYIATTFASLTLDTFVYPTPIVGIVECMGRNAGWLTATTKLASFSGCSPDLIYLPESDFDVDTFILDVNGVLAKKGKCMVAVSEGIHDKTGRLIQEVLGEHGTADAFGHTQLGGVASLLAVLVKKRTGVKAKGMVLSFMQRSFSAFPSKTDITEAFNAGKNAVKFAVSGRTGKMVCYERADGEKYKIKYKLVPLKTVANAVKPFPKEWITADGHDVTDEFISYALPLIQGEVKIPTENGLPKYAKLNK